MFLEQKAHFLGVKQSTSILVQFKKNPFEIYNTLFINIGLDLNAINGYNSAMVISHDAQRAGIGHSPESPNDFIFECKLV